MKHSIYLSMGSNFTEFFHRTIPRIFPRLAWFVLLSSFWMGGCTMPLVWGDIETPPVVQTDQTTQEIVSTPPGLTQDLSTPPATATLVTTTSVPTPFPQPTIRPTSTALPYILQPGGPAATQNFAHPDLGCAWMGVAGQVLNAEREPAMGLLVEVGGELSGSRVRFLAMTGTAPAYGPGGFEITLSDHPQATDSSLWIQVYDLSGLPASPQVYINTFDTCEQNLVLVNFMELPGMDFQLYLPSASTTY